MDGNIIICALSRQNKYKPRPPSRRFHLAEAMLLFLSRPTKPRIQGPLVIGHVDSKLDPRNGHHLPVLVVSIHQVNVIQSQRDTVTVISNSHITTTTLAL